MSVQEPQAHLRKLAFLAVDEMKQAAGEIQRLRHRLEVAEARCSTLDLLSTLLGVQRQSGAMMAQHVSADIVGKLASRADALEDALADGSP